VRRVKTAHQRLLSRVLTVREALHRLMGEFQYLACPV